MPIDFRTESLREPVASRDTAISCLVRLGAQNGVDLEIETVRRRADLDGDTITVSRLIKLADECGLPLEWIRLDWQGLKATGFSQLLIFRENTNCVVLTGGARAGAEEVSIWDPHHDGVIFFMGREDFERAWNGHALMITPKEPGKASASPSQQSAFKAIASEIRGTPADIVKPESPGNPTPGAGSSSPGPDGAPARRWRRPLLGFASIGAVASISITIFLLTHPAGDEAVSIGSPAREDAARRPEMTSTPAPSESAALATENAPSPAPTAGAHSQQQIRPTRRLPPQQSLLDPHRPPRHRLPLRRPPTSLALRHLRLRQQVCRRRAFLLRTPQHSWRAGMCSSARAMSLRHGSFTSAPPMQEKGKRRSSWGRLSTLTSSTRPACAVRAEI
jgi:hypothetical protein